MQGEKYTRACEKVVKREKTIQLWRNKIPRIDRYFKSLIDSREENVVDSIELKLESRLLRGEGTSAEYIFYLVNRRPQKWQNNYRVEHSGKVNGQEVRVIVVNNANIQDREKRSDGERVDVAAEARKSFSEQS